MSVLEQGRIAGASQQMRRSPSAVSRSISILEDKFGRPLLTRSRAGFSATAEGKLIAARCRIINEELHALRELLRRSGNKVTRADSASLFRMQFDISRLRALAAVHDFGSVQRASQLLSLSQPAISSSIRHLETDLGVDLFSRTQKGMIATPAGVSATICAKRILAEMRKMKDDVASADGVSSGLVCVGGLAYSRNALLPEALKRILIEFPNIVVRTVEGPIGALLIAMHAGEVDVLICARPDPALLESVTVEPVVEDSMGLFVCNTHPLAGASNVTARDLLQYPFILPPLGSITRQLLEKAFVETAGRGPQGVVETSSYSIIRKLLVNSDQISFRSMSEFREEMAEGRIVALKLDFELPSRSICLLQRRGVKMTSAISDFLAVTREIAVLARPQTRAT
jgi:LysR family transcriptional regulator of gallate degradation